MKKLNQCAICKTKLKPKQTIFGTMDSYCEYCYIYRNGEQIDEKKRFLFSVSSESDVDEKFKLLIDEIFEIKKTLQEIWKRD